MGKKGKISEYREILDRTLASPELTNDDCLQTLIRNQLLRLSAKNDDGCSESVIQHKTAQVSNFLDMLRSASVNEHGEWKLKSDNEEYRVMYRPGPHGTPLHTLLVEGYVDGPVDTCLCISFETTLFPKWWPQLSFPPFKITMCKCVEKVRIGEHISLIRVKVTWPLSAREAVVHFFLFEYLKDGLVVVLINSISDIDSIDESTHGFTRDKIPEAEEVVRIDIVGGYAIQKVNSERSYFRTIATVDLKLDFVPPSLINFLSRQLVGSGFTLYKKVVAKSTVFDEDYSKALKDPMYTRIRETLYKSDATEKIELKDNSSLPLEEHSPKDVQNGENPKAMDKITFAEIEEDDIGENTQPSEPNANDDDETIDILQNTSLATNTKKVGEIEEEKEESEGSTDLEADDESSGEILSDRVKPKSPVNYKARIPLSPEVEHALATLEKAISLVRERVASGQNVMLEKSAETGSSSADDSTISIDSEVSGKGKITERTSPESRNRPSSDRGAREVNHNKIAPDSACESSENGPLEIQIAEVANQQDKEIVVEVNGDSLNVEKKLSRKKKYGMCCFHVSDRVIVP